MRLIKNHLNLEYSNRVLDISFNICLPIDYANNNKLLFVFQKIIAASEFIENTHYNLSSNIKYLSEVYKSINYIESRTKVFEVPETVAEVVSYVTSAGVRSGIHAIIDFGAGTTDISIINVKFPRNKNQSFNFYSSLVIPMGFRKIERLFREKNKKEIVTYLQKIRERSVPAWREAYNFLKYDEYWKGDKVQVLISGGGANQEEINNIFNMPVVPSESWDVQRYPISKLPDPEDYREKQVPFYRMAVAYGLTIAKPKLLDLKYTLPKDSKDDTPKQRIRKKDYNDERNPNNNWLG